MDSKVEVVCFETYTTVYGLCFVDKKGTILCLTGIVKKTASERHTFIVNFTLPFEPLKPKGLLRIPIFPVPVQLPCITSGSRSIME